MPPLPRFLLVFLALAVAGCSGGRMPSETDQELSASALRSHLRALTDPLVPADSAQAAARAQYAARRMRASGMMPVLEGGFLLRQDGSSTGPLIDPARAHALGYVAGRHPSYDDDLVLVAADLSSAGAAAVLEAARVLVDEARFTQTPERTVLFALWASPRTGALGLADYLANPTWALEKVHRVLLVAADTAATRESRLVLDARDIVSEVVTVPRDSLAESLPVRGAMLVRAARLTEALLARTRAATTASSD